MIARTIFTALAAYVATAVDYFIIMLIFFSAEKTKNRKVGFVIGHYLGMFILYAISVAAAYGVGFIPQQWIIGLLGFVPIALGLKVLFQKEADEDVKTEILKRTQKMNGLVLSHLIDHGYGRRRPRRLHSLVFFIFSNGNHHYPFFFCYFHRVALFA